MRHLDRFAVTAVGKSAASSLSLGPDNLFTVQLHCVPYEPWIERQRGEHGQYDYRAERYRPGTRIDRCNRTELHERYQDGDDVDIEHRPTADKLHPPVDTCPASAA